MQIRAKQSYHPFVVVAFYLHILSEKLLSQIPRSTRYEWQHKPVMEFTPRLVFLTNRTIQSFPIGTTEILYFHIQDACFYYRISTIFYRHKPGVEKTA